MDKLAACFTVYREFVNELFNLDTTTVPLGDLAGIDSKKVGDYQ